MPSTTFLKHRMVSVGMRKMRRSMRDLPRCERNTADRRTLFTSCGTIQPLAMLASQRFNRCADCELRTSTGWPEKAYCLRGCIPKWAARRAEPHASPVAMPFAVECTTSACYVSRTACVAPKSHSPKCFPKRAMQPPSTANGIWATSNRVIRTSRVSTRHSLPGTTRSYR